MRWLIYLYIVLGILLIWFIFGTVLPYFLLAWYLRTSKICKTKKLLKISKKAKGKDKEKTLKNTYNYITKNYKGDPYQYNPLNVLNLQNFTMKKIMKRKRRFMWCYSHVKLLKGILIATKQFSNKDIKIRWSITPLLAIHQYAVVNIGRAKYKVDPFYHKFKKI
jgi:hypothetical protein